MRPPTCGPGAAALACALLLCLLSAPAMAGTDLTCELPRWKPPETGWILFRLDPAGSRVRFDAKAFLHDFAGETSLVSGLIRLRDSDRLADAEACLRIDAASLRTGIGARDRSMREDQLETEKFPTIAFDLGQAEGVRREAGGRGFTVRGTLTLHGVLREIQVAIRAEEDGDAVRLTGRVPLKMTDYGIPIPRFLFFTVEDEVVVNFDLLARRTP